MFAIVDEACGGKFCARQVLEVESEGEALRLGSGSTVVTTEKGMKTQVQRLVILPAVSALGPS